MSRQGFEEGRGYQEEQTGIHLLMAGIVSIFSLLLVFVTLAMSWELWTIPLALIGMAAVWVFHIGGVLSGRWYEYLCVSLVTMEFFYFGVHPECLFDVPPVVLVLLFMLVLLARKKLLYLVEAMYVLVLFYHLLALHTISLDMGIEGIVHLFLGMAGTAGALVLSAVMIDRRREEQERMYRIAEQLEEAKQRNADFLSNVSHELRTPINMVTGISEVALGKDLSPDIRESMLSIQLAGKRLAGQINDILDYTELVENTMVVTNENYMPTSVINDTIAMAVMQGCDYDLEMVFDLDTRLPAVLVGDAEKIARVLRILVQNAIKFTKEGGLYVYVGFRRESYGINLDITVSDTGIGMTTSQLTRIYDDFYQADSGRSRYAGGLGLGIPIARGLLRSMEGFIHYESREGIGTQVHVSIPQGVADAAPGMTVSNPKQFCVLCYFKQEEYSRSEVRQYYDNMMLHMADGLGIEAYRAYHFEELEILMNGHTITHLFLAQQEYRRNISYFEDLGKDICVVLIAEREFMLPEGSRLVMIHKPFFALPIVNLLNGVTHGKDLGESLIADRMFSCAGVKALVVDDEEMNLVVARGILNSYDMQVDTCLSGAQAVEKCMNTAYDLIFLDHMMPGMDGVETLKRIRALKDNVYQNLPIIALTANAISGAREMFKGEGFTEFVPKPIERSVLERALRRVLPEQGLHFYTEEDEKKEESKEEETKKEETKKEEPSLFGDLQKLGIDTGMGMDYCSGAKDFYLEMLKMYCAQSTEKRKEIVSLYESENWGDYAIKVHALKSTSLTIGAKDLSELAKALELAGKGGDIEYIRQNHKSLLDFYDRVCGGIADSMDRALSGGKGGEDRD